MGARDAYTPGEVGEVIDAFDRWFGEEYVLALDDTLSHLCMVIGARFSFDRRIKSRCGREQLRGVVTGHATCIACFGRDEIRNFPP